MGFRAAAARPAVADRRVQAADGTRVARRLHGPADEVRGGLEVLLVLRIRKNAGTVPGFLFLGFCSIPEGSKPLAGGKRSATSGRRGIRVDLDPGLALRYLRGS